jgi:hypothetical protein
MKFLPPRKSCSEPKATCSYYTAITLAQLALKPEMEPGKVSTL